MVMQLSTDDISKLVSEALAARGVKVIGGHTSITYTWTDSNGRGKKLRADVPADLPALPPKDGPYR